MTNGERDPKERRRAAITLGVIVLAIVLAIAGLSKIAHLLATEPPAKKSR